MTAPVKRLLDINTRLLEKESEIQVAKIVRRVSILGIILGPGILVPLYVITYITWREFDMAPINGPLIPLGVIMTIGGGIGLVGTFVDPQSNLAKLDLDLQLLREERRLQAADLELDLHFKRLSYKTDIYSDVSNFRRESLYYRRIANLLQAVVIIGSIGSTAISGLSIQFPPFRWATVLSTFIVGVSAGFIGYFKFREKSFYLQQTADAIEHEANEADLGIGKYAQCDDQEVLLRLVEEVERLKVEQRKREQNLDQPREREDTHEV